MAVKIFLFSLKFAVVGCSSFQPVDLENTYKELAAEFKKQNESLRAAYQSRREGLEQVTVTPLSDGSGILVSVALERAPLADVIARILQTANADFIIPEQSLSGYVTAGFDNVELLTAVNRLVGVVGWSATLQDETIVLRQLTTTMSAEQRVIRDYTLQHLNLDDAMKMVASLFRFDREENNDDSSEGVKLTVGALADTNTLYIAGSQADTDEVIQLLTRADREIPHVLIELIVVEFDTQALSALGGAITGGARSEIESLSVNPANITGGNINISYLQGGASIEQIAASINVLAGRNKAQVISRPYMSTRSNKEATMDIVTDRFVAIQSSVDGASVTTTDAIPAGVSLKVLPTVHGESFLTVDLSVEESRFESTVDAALVQKRRNSAQTSVQIQSGQTIIVGGLNSHLQDVRKSGVPVLRSVPLLKTFFSSKTQFKNKRELVIYVTPHIWSPSAQLPGAAHKLPVDAN